MRFVLEILAVGCLLFIGWERPFKHWIAAPAPPVVTTQPEAVRQATPPMKDWMWDPQRANPLDRGRYNRDVDVTRAPEVYYP